MRDQVIGGYRPVAIGPEPRGPFATRAGRIGLLVAAALGLYLSALAAPTAQQIMDKMQTVGQAVSYHGVRVLEVRYGGRSTTLKQKAYFAPGRRQRFEVISPRERAGDLAVLDGQRHWRYSKADNEVHVALLPPGAGPMGFPMGPGNRRSTAKWQVRGQVTVAGRKCWVLVMAGPGGRQPAKLSVDSERFVILAAEHQRMHGEDGESWKFDNITFCSQIDPQLFTFRPPPGAKVVQTPAGPSRLSLQEAERALGIKALVPTYLPPGFSLASDGIGVVQRGPNSALWLLFRGPGKTFSIFQSRRLPSGGKPDHAVARWDAGPYTLLVVGDISAADAEKVRQSLPPAPRK